MLFTVVPLEDVLEGIEDDPVPTVEMAVGGVTMELELEEDFQAKIVRVISTDPRDYLNPSFQPGSTIYWT